MDKHSAVSSSTMRLNLLETLRETEAREWMTRYQQKVKELGKAKASAWWQTTIADIAKRRGNRAADDLRKKMNEIRSQS